jgi:hypothetical protein
MSSQSLDVAPGPGPRLVRTEAGQVLQAPSDWALLPPGDAALTRRVKLDGPSWTVTERKGRKRFSRGVWAPAATIERCRARLHDERTDPRHGQRLEAGRQRRAREQEQYGREFCAEVVAFLGFAAAYTELAERLALAITAHATPVGSGTVARTRRIAIDRRAEAATIAWLRHQTTGYDGMKIPRIKGMRRGVRRLLAQRARELLDRYRRAEPSDPSTCPLRRALLCAGPERTAFQDASPP